MARVDIFIRKPGAGDYGSDWKLYVPSVTPANAEHIVPALERQGEHVATFQSKNGGKMLYETGVDHGVAPSATSA